jgi:acetyl-CoA carboxylase biotin carboxyl carrier protein
VRRAVAAEIHIAKIHIARHATLFSDARVGPNFDEIAEILKIIDASSCDELVIETSDMKLLVRRGSAAAASATAHDEPATQMAAAPSITAPSVAAAQKPATAPHQIEIVAPMIGTFYRAPSPDAPPFVEIGSMVRKGQPLCLIEVMKLFTTIGSEHDGRIVRIGAENAELVEFGRTLFVIEPA